MSKIQSHSENTPHILVLGMGGTIAGLASNPDKDPLQYAAGQVEISSLLDHIKSAIPESFTGKALSVFMYAYAENSRSSCCYSNDLIISTGSKIDNSKTSVYGGLDINNYKTPLKFFSTPKTLLTASEKFPNLSKCKLKDGDPVLDNMTIGFPLPAGRTDLTKPEIGRAHV